MTLRTLFQSECSKRLRRFGRDQTGATMVLVALAAPAIVGLAALAVEGGYAYSQHAAMQSVSDLAALSAAEARTRDGNAANPTLEARAIAAHHGYVNNIGDVTVAVNSPPTTGTYPNGSVEVIVSRQQKPILMSLFRKSAYTIAGRSVAVAGATGNGCILALDTSSSDIGISAGGSPVVNMPNCAAYSNSPATDSAYIGGSASVTLHSLYAVGGINGTLVAGVLHTGVGALADPYAGKFTTPTNPFNTCTYRSSSKMPVNGTQVVPPSNGPAYICYSVNLNASDVLNLGPGTYIFDGAQNGALKATGQSSLIANGATLVFINGADVALNGGGATTIVAPTTASNSNPYTPYKGLTVWQPAGNGASAQIAGGANQTITGAIYMPSAYLSYTGASTLNVNGCTQIIAWRINFSGNSQVDNVGCSSSGVVGFGYQSPNLMN